MQNRAKQRARRLNNLIHAKSKLNLTNRLKIYTTVIRPIMTYACTSWGQANTTRLQIIQNKILRKITGAPWFLRNDDIHNDLKIDKIKDTHKQLMTRTLDRISIHPHDNLRHAIDYNLQDPSKIKRPRTLLT